MIKKVKTNVTSASPFKAYHLKVFQQSESEEENMRYSKKKKKKARSESRSPSPAHSDSGVCSKN